MSFLSTMKEPIQVLNEGGKVLMKMSPEKYSFLTHYVGYTYLAGASVVLIGTTYVAIRVGVPLLNIVHDKIKGGK